jgi:hypothetical protein
MSTQVQKKQKITEEHTPVAFLCKSSEFKEIEKSLEEIGKKEYELWLTIDNSDPATKKLLQSSAEHGYPEALYELGLYSQFEYNMHKAYSKGYFMATYALAHYYLGRNGKPQDLNLSLKFFTQIVNSTVENYNKYPMQLQYSWIMKKYLETKLKCDNKELGTFGFALDNRIVGVAINDIATQEMHGSHKAVYSEVWGPYKK